MARLATLSGGKPPAQQSSTAHRLPVTRPSPTARGRISTLGQRRLYSPSDDSSHCWPRNLITNEGVSDSDAAATIFNGSSTAGSAILIANGGRTSEGGAIVFNGASTGGIARVKVFDNGYLDISRRQSGMTIGSIEGSGNVFLGANNLTVGTNGINTSFSGVISGSGSLAKIGSGILTLQANDCIADTRRSHSRKRLNYQTRLYWASRCNRLFKGQRRSATAGHIWRSNERRAKYPP